MTHARDDKDVQTTERLLAGAPVDPAAGPVPAELVALVETLRAAGRGVAPAPSAELARVLRDGRAPEVVPLERRRAARPMTRRAVVTVALGTKIALVSAAAAAALTGVATLGPVPEAIREPARDLVEDLVGTVPWAPSAPSAPSGPSEPSAPADEAPAGEDDGGRPGGAGSGADQEGGAPVGPAGEEPGRSDEAPGRPGTPGQGNDPDAPADDDPGRSDEAPGRPETPGQSGDHRTTPTPATPQEPPADRPVVPGPPGGAGRSGAVGDLGTAAAEDVAGQPYPSVRVGR